MMATPKIMAEYASAELAARDARQRSIFDWCVRAFKGGDNSPRIRALRFIEEAIELGQAMDLSADDMHRLVDYVMGRPKGEVWQEVGGVSLTLNALCEATGHSQVAAELMEIDRINAKPIEHFQNRQREKMEAGLK